MCEIQSVQNFKSELGLYYAISVPNFCNLEGCLLFLLSMCEDKYAERFSHFIFSNFCAEKCIEICRPKISKEKVSFNENIV